MAPLDTAKLGQGVIDRREIIDIATTVGLNPHVVEKDYVLGWMLAAIRAHPDIGDSWVFKGGTCLKKCFFETYRFSEDLDFTLRDPAHIDEGFLKRVFAEIGQWIYEASGVEIPVAMQAFDIFRNPRGHIACQGKIAYRGPVSPQGNAIPRVKLDLTADERIVLPPEFVPVFHPYSDVPEGGIEILAYAYEEAFGEKVRALGERTRPRDLYDVISLFRHAGARPAAALLLDVLRQKCAFKGIAVPRFEDVIAHRDELAAGWDNMLAHQLPSLLPLDSFWLELPQFFDWLMGGATPVQPMAFALSAGDTILRTRELRLPVSGQVQSAIEVIRFAGFNRICVEIDYRDEKGVRSSRTVEPYSLRRTSEGKILLEVHDVGKNAHRSLRVDRIQQARVTNAAFAPRHAIELTPDGLLQVLPSEKRIATSRRPPSYASRRHGPVFVYQCPQCDKKFRRSQQNNQLNPHKDKNGYNCFARVGLYVDTTY